MRSAFACGYPSTFVFDKKDMIVFEEFSHSYGDATNKLKAPAVGFGGVFETWYQTES